MWWRRHWPWTTSGEHVIAAEAQSSSRWQGAKWQRALTLTGTTAGRWSCLGYPTNIPSPESSGTVPSTVGKTLPGLHGSVNTVFKASHRLLRLASVCRELRSSGPFRSKPCMCRLPCYRRSSLALQQHDTAHHAVVTCPAKKGCAETQ